MADSLVLTGVKDIKKQTGTEMVRRFPKRGGDVFSLKRWWVEGGVSTVNTNATVFDVTTGAGTVKLAVESTMSTNIRIEHDGSFNFTFYGINEVGRAALFTETFDLIEHYVFPTISGGQTMTVTPAGAADRPSDGPAVEAETTIGTVTVTGETAPEDGDTVTYTAAISGDAGDLSYNWAMNGSGTVISFSGNTVQGEWSGTQESIVSCVVTSGDANVSDSPVTGSITVTPVDP